LAAQINANIASGSLITVPPDTHPLLPKNTIGEFVQTQDGKVNLPSGYDAVVVTTANATIQGSGGHDQSILVGDGNLTFTALKGSGTIAAGGGDDSILIGAKDKGDWKIDLGNGNDTVRAFGTGNDTINAGAGEDLIKLGAGENVVTTAGEATVLGGSGAATIFGSSGKLDFVGDSGDASVEGGSMGSNIFEAGSGNETLTGASASDTVPNPEDTFLFLKGHAGGTDIINNFIAGDVIKLKGYGSDEITNALDNAKYTPQGATITLSDNSKIMFTDVRYLDPKSFMH
jgi:Ca2+-binding RTX toxin-like protein